jgi:hypothetical protein
MTDAISQTSGLKFQFLVSIDDDGNRSTKTKTFSGLRLNADYQDCVDVAKAIASLCEYELYGLNKVDTTCLLDNTIEA